MDEKRWKLYLELYPYKKKKNLDKNIAMVIKNEDVEGSANFDDTLKCATI